MLPTFNELASLYSCTLNCSVAKRKLPQLLFAIDNKIINPGVEDTKQSGGLVVRAKGNKAPILHVVEVSDALEADIKLFHNVVSLDLPKLVRSSWREIEPGQPLWEAST
jgi:hypothetical protein